MEAEVKYARVSTSRPVVNIWWAHTTNPNKPIPIIAQIIPIEPKTVFFIVSCIIICETKPKPGKIRI